MSQYTPLVVVALMFLAWLLRRFSPAGGFLHSALGATVIAGLSGLLGAVAQAIQAHGLSKATIIPAVTSFLMSFIATSNPSMAAQLSASDKTPAETPSARTKQAGFATIPAVLFAAAVALAALALSGCATSATKPGATLASKIADDEAAIQQICTDVQTQCLPKFANPLPAIKDLAAALADFAGATADPTLAVGGVLQVIDAYPEIASDAAASMCVIRTVVADIKKLQPQKAAALDRLVARLEAELAARQSLALVEVPVACQQRPDDDHGACRKVVLDCGDNTRSCFDVASR